MYLKVKTKYLPSYLEAKSRLKRLMLCSVEHSACVMWYALLLRNPEKRREYKLLGTINHLLPVAPVFGIDGLPAYLIIGTDIVIIKPVNAEKYVISVLDGGNRGLRVNIDYILQNYPQRVGSLFLFNMNLFI